MAALRKPFREAELIGAIRQSVGAYADLHLVDSLHAEGYRGHQGGPRSAGPGETGVPRGRRAELKAFHLVSGQYDAVVISEAPNFETVARLSLATGAGGNIRTESMRAFTEEEYRKIIATLP